MSTRTKTRFESVVRNKLLENKLAGRKPDSIRGLARTMAKGDGVRAETYKRSLFKWMAPGEPQPSPESRAIVAAALGLERSELAEDDDEEADPVSDLFQRAVAIALQQHLKTKSPPRNLPVVIGTGSDNEGA